MTGGRFPGGVDEAIEHADAKTRVLESDNTRSHTGNATRLVRRCGDMLIFALGLDWLVFDGTRWQADSTGTAYRAARDVARDVHSEAAAAYTLAAKVSTDEEHKQVAAIAKRMWSWARDCEQAHTIRSTLEVASNHSRFRVAPESLDAQPTLLNCVNGTLDLETFDLRPHDPSDRLTKKTAANYDPAAKAPTWETNMERFIPDPEVRAYLQRCAGQALFGHRSEELLYLYGHGANFKSTFLRGLRAALGDYADIRS
jgi:putative DNA primase/helicase